MTTIKPCPNLKPMLLLPPDNCAVVNLNEIAQGVIKRRKDREKKSMMQGKLYAMYTHVIRFLYTIVTHFLRMSKNPLSKEYATMFGNRKQ